MKLRIRAYDDGFTVELGQVWFSIGQYRAFFRWYGGAGIVVKRPAAMLFSERQRHRRGIMLFGLWIGVLHTLPVPR